MQGERGSPHNVQLSRDGRTPFGIAGGQSLYNIDGVTMAINTTQRAAATRASYQSPDLIVRYK